MGLHGRFPRFLQLLPPGDVARVCSLLPILRGYPWGFHLANLLANGVVVLLLFLVSWRMFRSLRGVAAAAIFALHPIHTEAVNDCGGYRT